MLTSFVLEIQYWIVILALALPRILVMFLMLPFLSQQIIPGTLRNGIAIAFSLVILPVVASQIEPYHIELPFLLILIVKEAIIGLLIGYLVAIIFWAVASTGFFIDLQRGAMSAMQFNPFVGSLASPIGAFLTNTMVALLFSGGGFLALLESLYLSYATWPVVSYFPRFDSEATVFYLEQLDALMELTLLFAGPVVISMLLVEIGIMLIGRFVPQINVFLLAMPLKSIMSFFILALYITYIIQHANIHFHMFSSIFKKLETLLQ